MKPIVTSIEIHRPVDEVFAYLTDLTNAPEWTTDVVEVRHDGPFRVGATGVDVRRMGGKQVEMPWEVTAWDPPREAVFEYRGPFPATVVFRFESTPSGGTRLACESEFRLRGVHRLLTPMIAREARKVDAIQFARAKDVLESRTAADRG